MAEAADRSGQQGSSEPVHVLHADTRLRVIRVDCHALWILLALHGTTLRTLAKSLRKDNMHIHNATQAW